MRRLPAVGATVTSPFGNIVALRRALSKIGVSEHFRDDELRQVHARLAEIVGDWTAEKGRLEVAPIARNLLSMSHSLLDAAKTLQSLETGIQRGDLIETVNHLMDYLALESSIGSRENARSLVASFRSEAALIGHASMIAAAGLASAPGKRGRSTHHWYDAFTSLLLDIAGFADVAQASAGMAKRVNGRAGSLRRLNPWRLCCLLICDLRATKLVAGA
jgi:hypothetical protein